MIPNRCGWVNLKNHDDVTYHDEEWGIPVHDDRKHFEMLSLEGAQAGLSWSTILKKRQGYLNTFYNFDVDKIIKMSDQDLEKLTQNTDIIRNKRKIFSVRQNAFVFKQIQEEFGSFDKYIWRFTDFKTIYNDIDNIKMIPTKTPISDKISKDLKNRGMNFVGSTIIYAYMQAIGMVNDHTNDCDFKNLSKI